MNTELWQTQIINPEQEEMVYYPEVISPKEKCLTTRNTFNVVFMDASDSMMGATGRGDPRLKIEAEKDAITSFSMNLPESAYLAIVVFSSDVQLIVPPGPIGNRKLEIANKILAVQPSGATAMCKTLKMGVSIFQQAPPEFFLRAYKITDGMSTDGNPLSWGEKLKNMGVILSLIGVGEGNQIDESLMRQMASFSEEKNAPRYFHFVDSVNMTGFFKRETTTVTK